MTTLFTEEHHALRAQIRRFVADRLAPNVETWEDAGTFPRMVYRDAASAGVLGIGFPEAYGGAGGDVAHMVVVAEELTRSGSPGLAASLGSLCIALPPVVHAGTEAQKQRWLPPVLSGEWIAALAITEPGGGSDVANLTTRAVRTDSGWTLHGQKTFITSGTRADLIVVAARTGGPGAGGVSLFGVETGRGGMGVGKPL
jgi:acyl-CoA dehydrogenase